MRGFAVRTALGSNLRVSRTQRGIRGGGLLEACEGVVCENIRVKEGDLVGILVGTVLVRVAARNVCV